MSGVSDDQFRKVLDNNVISNHWLIQMVAPQMIERKEGSIIIVSSIGGLRGSRPSACTTSRGRDFQLARNLAVEFGPHNVRVNCIAPGLIKTDFARALWEDPERYKQSTQAPRCAASASRSKLPALPSTCVRRQQLHDGPGTGRRRRRHDLMPRR